MLIEYEYSGCYISYELAIIIDQRKKRTIDDYDT